MVYLYTKYMRKEKKKTFEILFSPFLLIIVYIPFGKSGDKYSGNDLNLNWKLMRFDILFVCQNRNSNTV